MGDYDSLIGHGGSLRDQLQEGDRADQATQRDGGEDTRAIMKERVSSLIAEDAQAARGASGPFRRKRKPRKKRDRKRDTHARQAQNAQNASWAPPHAAPQGQPWQGQQPQSARQATSPGPRPMHDPRQDAGAAAYPAPGPAGGPAPMRPGYPGQGEQPGPQQPRSQQPGPRQDATAYPRQATMPDSMPAQGNHAPLGVGPSPTPNPAPEQWGPAPQPGYGPQGPAQPQYAQARYPGQDGYQAGPQNQQPYPQQNPANRQWGDATQAGEQPGRQAAEQPQYAQAVQGGQPDPRQELPPQEPSAAPDREPERDAAPGDGADTRAPGDGTRSDGRTAPDGLEVEDATDDGGPVIDAVALPDPTPTPRADTVLDVTVEDEPDATDDAASPAPDDTEPADHGANTYAARTDTGSTGTDPHSDATDTPRPYAPRDATPRDTDADAQPDTMTPRVPVQEPPAPIGRGADAPRPEARAHPMGGMPMGDAPTEALPPLTAPATPHGRTTGQAAYPGPATPGAGRPAWIPDAAVDRDYTTGARRKRRTAPMVAAGAVLLAALLAGAVFAGHSLATRTATQQATQSDTAADGQSHDVALTACLTTQQSAESRHDDWKQAVAASDQAAVADPSSLQDPSLLDALKQARTDPAQTPADCSADMDTGTLDATSAAWSAASSAWTQGTQDIQSASQAVTDSQAAKTRQDKRDALGQKIQEARELLASSDGQVADAQTRFTLTDAINAAQGVLDDQGSTDDSVDQASSGLDAAMQSVNDSIAKKQADDAAAAQAAAAASAQAGSAGSSGSSGSSTGSSRRSSGQTTQRQSTQPSAAPQPTVTATPTPSHQGMNVG